MILALYIFMKLTIIFVLALFLVGCATTPPPPVQSNKSKRLEQQKKELESMGFDVTFKK